MKQPDIRSLFASLQAEMRASLLTARGNVGHPSTQGGAVEEAWLRFLGNYLPRRYEVASAFVLDAWGRISEQIDVVIFDRQYSPFLLKSNGVVYVPAESVYGVLEVKPRLTSHAISYAGAKIASVRRLLRTSAPVPHAGGVFPPRAPFEILGGLVADQSGWVEPFGQHFQRAMKRSVPESRVDLCCVLDGGSALARVEGGQVTLQTVSRAHALVFFVLKLLELLQSRGTVPAMDIAAYSRRLPIKETRLTVRRPVSPSVPQA